MSSAVNRNLDAALAYARLGIHVLPCHSIDGNGRCTCGDDPCKQGIGKHPRIGQWQDRATCDEQQIRKWWTKWPDANIGAVPGRSGHVVVDQDPWKEGEAEIVARLQEQHGPLGGKVILSGEHQVNGNVARGEHHWLRLPAGFIPPNKWHAENIEVKCLGSYVLLPPSLHRSGVRYAEQDKRASFADAAEVPPWVLNGARAGSGSGESASQNASRVLTGLPVGKRSLRALEHGLPVPDADRGEAHHRDVAVGIARNFYEAGYHENVVRVLMARIFDNPASALRPGDPWTSEDLEDIVRSVVRNAVGDQQGHLPKDLDSSDAVIDLGAVMERGPERLKWLFEPLVAEAKSTLLAGDEGSGKSMVALAIIVALVRQGIHCAYLDEELGSEEVAARFIDLGLFVDEVSTYVHYAYELSPTFKDVGRLVAWVQKHDIRLVVFDSASDFYVSAEVNENANSEIAKWYKKFANHLRAFGVASIVIEHTGHDGDRARGARAKGQKADLPYYLSLPKGATFDDQTTTHAKFTRGKRRFRELPPEADVHFMIGGRDGEFVFEREEMPQIGKGKKRASSLPDQIVEVIDEAEGKWVATGKIRTRINEKRGEVSIKSNQALLKHLHYLEAEEVLERRDTEAGQPAEWRRTEQ